MNWQIPMGYEQIHLWLGLSFQFGSLKVLGNGNWGTMGAGVLGDVR